MNIDGVNGLACLTKVSDISDEVSYQSVSVCSARKVETTQLACGRNTSAPCCCCGRQDGIAAQYHTPTVVQQNPHSVNHRLPAGGQGPEESVAHRAAAAHVRGAGPGRGHVQLLRAVQVHQALPRPQGRRRGVGVSLTVASILMWNVLRVWHFDEVCLQAQHRCIRPDQVSEVFIRYAVCMAANSMWDHFACWRRCIWTPAAR